MKVSKYKKKPEEEDSSAHQNTFGKNESSPERAKDRHTVPYISPVRQTILKCTEEQEHENIAEGDGDAEKIMKNSRNLLLHKQGNL